MSVPEGFRAAEAEPDGDEIQRRIDHNEALYEHAMGDGVVDLDEERAERRETECPICFGWAVGPCLRSACEPDGSNAPPEFWNEDEG